MKKSVGLIILFLIIGLIIGVVGGYFYHGMVVGVPKCEESTKSGTTKASVKIVDITDSVVSDTMAKINRLTCDILPYRYFLEKDKVTAKDISNDVALNLVDINYYTGVRVDNKDKIKKDSNGNEYFEVDAAEVEKQVKSILGDDYKFEHKTYKESTIAIFEYDQNNNKYKVIMQPFGCTVGPHAPSLNQVTKAEEKGNKLIITYKVLFGEDSIPENPGDNYFAKYYKDYKHTQQIKQDDLDYVVQDNIFVADSASLKNLNLGSTYQFTFEKQNDNYVFVSSELMK